MLKKKITVRYYSAHPAFRKYKAYEIPQAYFSGYEINKSILGLKKEIVLTAKGPKGEMSFPPVSISALSKKELEYLIRFLDKYKKG